MSPPACLSGEHITGQAADHLPTERGQPEESGRTAPRLQAHVSVAVLRLSPSHPPPVPPSVPLSRHRYRVFPPAVGQRLTPASVRAHSFLAESSTNSLNVVDNAKKTEED